MPCIYCLWHAMCLVWSGKAASHYIFESKMEWKHLKWQHTWQIGLISIFNYCIAASSWKHKRVKKSYNKTGTRLWLPEQDKNKKQQTWTHKIKTQKNHLTICRFIIIFVLWKLILWYEKIHYFTLIIKAYSAICLLNHFAWCT